MESPRPHFARAHVDSTDKLSSAFLTGRRTYAQQFDQLYYKRLQHLKPHILAHAQQRWGSQAQLTASVLNVDSSLGTTYIIGTVFIDSPRKPSTLQQVESEHRVSDPVVTQGYRGTDEAVFLEDESGRIRLMGEQIPKTLLASGVVAAVLGVETAAGDFEVADVCFAGMPPQPGPLRITEDPGADSDADPLLMLVSGLGATLARPITLQMQLLGELLSGTLGSTRTQQLAARIAHVVVAGNTMDLPTAPLGHAEDARTNDRSGAARLAAQVDDFLADIAGCVPLTVMPGARDPADASLPQQPMPRGMFAQCARTSAFRSLSNPASMQIGGLQMLGSSGQNVDDLMRYAARDEAVTPCALAALSLTWRHIAPSAPDTLWCFPFTTHDPFVLDTAPHVYFVANQGAFESTWALGTEGQRTLVMAIPSFAQTGQVVLLNTRTLSCSVLHIAL